mmetsp:Transcript_29188/g.56396  ORF Transcript_29188/g.56396 Transcript_29188/m.56396 type:complete len:238 (-) Transcript_29188:1179-1892(-)
MRAHGRQGGAHRIRRMGIVDKDGRPVFAGGSQLHTAPHCLEMAQRIEHGLRCLSTGHHKPCGQQRIVRLKSSDQVQARRVRLAAIFKADVLAGAVKALRSQVQVAAVAANGDDILSPCGGDGRHVDAPRVVDVDHGCTVLGQDPGKEARLGVEISLERLVIVQVILGKVREPSRFEGDSVQATLVETVGRGLHRGMGDAIGARFGEDAVQRDRLGRGVGQGGGPFALHPSGAKVDGA